MLVLAISDVHYMTTGTSPAFGARVIACTVDLVPLFGFLCSRSILLVDEVRLKVCVLMFKIRNNLLIYLYMLSSFLHNPASLSIS